MRKGCSDGLTPAECLYILNDYGEEERTREGMLAAILANLYENNLIKFSEERECKLTLTRKGKNALKTPQTLRSYEIERLEGIQDDDSEEIYYFDWEDIRKELVKRGVMKKYAIEKPFKIFGKTIFTRRKVVYEYDPKVKEILGKLKRMRDELNTSIRRRKLERWINTYGKSMCYAFPSIATTDGFKEVAEEIEDMVEWNELLLIGACSVCAAILAAAED